MEISGGAGFQTFGRAHLLWLLVLLAAGAALFAAAQREKGRRIPALAALLAASGRVLPGIALIAAGTYGADTLPLHVCSLAGYGCLAHFFFPGQVLSELLFFPGLLGGVCALLFPGWGYCPPLSFFSICEFLGHFGIVLYVLLRLRDGGIRPAVSRAWIPVLFCVLYAAVMLPFDRITGMNYGFLLLPAPDSPLSGIAGCLGSGIGYYAGYSALALLLLAVFYALWYFRQRNHRE